MARAAPKRADRLLEVVAVPAYATSTNPNLSTSGIFRRYFPVDRVVALPTEAHSLIGVRRVSQRYASTSWSPRPTPVPWSVTEPMTRLPSFCLPRTAAAPISTCSAVLLAPALSSTLTSATTGLATGYVCDVLAPARAFAPSPKTYSSDAVRPATAAVGGFIVNVKALGLVGSGTTDTRSAGAGQSLTP